MAIITYNNVGIAAMAAAVPKNVIANYHYDLDIWPEEEVKKVVDKVGVTESRRILLMQLSTFCRMLPLGLQVTLSLLMVV